MDSRLQLSNILGVGLGEVEMIRNAGGTRSARAGVCRRGGVGWACGRVELEYAQARAQLGVGPQGARALGHQLWPARMLCAGGRVTPDVVRSLFVAQVQIWRALGVLHGGAGGE
jgi:hypothetical protein